MALSVSQRGIDLIKQYEGFVEAAYKCPAGKWTIGYGMTTYPNGTSVKQGDGPCTKEQATAWLMQHVNNAVLPAIRKHVKPSLTQNQVDALASFIFNLGSGNFASSTLLRKINENPRDPSIRDAFMMWTKSGGKELTGLKNRRAAEANLYFS